MESAKKKQAAAANRGGVIWLLVIAVLLVIVMVGVYIKVMVDERGDSRYQSILGEMKVLSQQLSKNAGQVTSGDSEAFRLLGTYNGDFSRNLSLLEEGDGTAMSGTPVAATPALDSLIDLWKKFSENIGLILTRQDTVTDLRAIVADINDQAAALLAISDEIATLMAQKGAPADQIYLATRQSMLSQRIINNVNRVLAGDAGSVTAADRFGRDARTFGSTIKGMLEGDPEQGIQQVKDPEVRAKVQQAAALFNKVGEQVTNILGRSPEMFDISEAVQKVLGSSNALLERLAALDSAYQGFVDARNPKAWMGHVAGGIALVLFIISFLRVRTGSSRQLAETESQRKASEEQNRRNQQAILRLLDEMGDLADGDLTVNATVTEDITGAIADSVNYAIEALRSLVTAINEAAEQVSGAATESEETANRLNQATEQQTQQIASATSAVNQMASSVENVSLSADQVAHEALESVSIASEGADVVQRTIAGMNKIREQIQETSKRIKRLGESSQEIGDIVELINDIAEQTNILALNAAIQAAMAGDAGRGFAVVADEVQRLAERSSGATRQIEALVKTIQTDTNEAVASMESSTSEVVAGARLAEDAGQALGKIERVAHHLAELVQNISSATRNQAQAASGITETMDAIQTITTQTAASTKQTAISIGNLAKMAEGLKKSAAGFKLPG